MIAHPIHFNRQLYGVYGTLMGPRIARDDGLYLYWALSSAITDRYQLYDVASGCRMSFCSFAS